MSGINKVILIGRLGHNPDSKTLESGSMITNISLATSEKWKNKDRGEYEEKTEWHRIIFFGRLAEIANQYLSKGSQVYIEGKIQTRKWEKDGVERFTTEIIANQMQMLDSKNTESPNTSATDYAKASGGNPEPFTDDIPF